MPLLILQNLILLYETKKQTFKVVTIPSMIKFLPSHNFETKISPSVCNICEFIFDEQTTKRKFFVHLFYDSDKKAPVRNFHVHSSIFYS